MRHLVIGLLLAAASASAQDTKTKQATKAPATQTKQDTKATQVKQQDAKAAASPGVKQQDTKAGDTTAGDSKAASTKAAAPGTKAPAGGAQRRPGLAIAPETTSTAVRVPVIMREAYDYDANGRRDPFFSLLATEELRPTVGDLQVTTVLYHPTRPIAVLRDNGTKIRYTVTVGTTLGRMRVVMIKPKVVIFTIEEFGLNRQDSLVVADSSKARAR